METGLFKKIAKIVQKRLTVNKDGVNEKQGYKYVTITDIKQTMQVELAATGLIYFGNTLAVEDRVIQTKNGEAKITRVKVNFTLADSETGETVEVVYFGDGMDSGDKGIYKAYTGAEKYFLIQTFGIATGDDPEKNGAVDDVVYSEPVDVPPSKPPLKDIPAGYEPTLTPSMAEYRADADKKDWKKHTKYPYPQYRVVKIDGENVVCKKIDDEIPGF